MSMARIASALETWQSMGVHWDHQRPEQPGHAFAGTHGYPKFQKCLCWLMLAGNRTWSCCCLSFSSVPSWKWTTMDAAQSEPWNEVTLTLPQGYTVWDWLMMLILVRSSRVWTVLVGGLEHFFIFPYWGQSSQLTFIFFRGVGIPPTNWSFLHLVTR